MHVGLTRAYQWIDSASFSLPAENSRKTLPIAIVCIIIKSELPYLRLRLTVHSLSLLIIILAVVAPLSVTAATPSRIVAPTDTMKNRCGKHPREAITLENLNADAQEKQPLARPKIVCAVEEISKCDIR
eukprot:scaffold154_cov80-Skeletonema_dohrnii-CCMP3373.AAC.4